LTARVSRDHASVGAPLAAFAPPSGTQGHKPATQHAAP